MHLDDLCGFGTYARDGWYQYELHMYWVRLSRESGNHRNERFVF